MRSVKILVGVVVALGLAGSMAAIVPAFAGAKGMYDNPKAPPMTPRLNLGKLSYDAFCASCHGKTAGGTDKGPTFIHRVYHPGHHGNGSFFIAAKKGARAHHWGFGDMKPVKGVTDDQLGAIVEYVRAVQQANGLF
ncbi:MAG: cytochrome c [Rhodospirillales bacterium]|nr:cytochrome c [Rhodospirillales bacterium]